MSDHGVDRQHQDHQELSHNSFINKRSGLCSVTTFNTVETFLRKLLSKDVLNTTLHQDSWQPQLDICRQIGGELWGLQLVNQLSKPLPFLTQTQSLPTDLGKPL